MKVLGPVIAATLLVPAAAAAQTVNGQAFWAAKPTIDDLPWPKPAPSGYVQYSCKVTLEGLLEGCTLAVAKPDGANAATDGLLSKLRMSAEGRRVLASDGTTEVIFQWYWGGKDPYQRPSTLSISVPWPAPAPAPVDEKRVYRPDWLEQPTPAELARQYPAAARKAGLKGFSTIRCTVRADGRLDLCEAGVDQPADQGFAQAQLNLAGRYRMATRDLDGKAVEGKRVLVAVRWEVPQSRALP